MSEFSVTVSAGAGSEKHNHDKKYRDKLKHVDERGEIIELVPYRSYQEQINEIMKPYIKQYNQTQEFRYQSAWDRYNNHEIKNKPRKRDFKQMSYDYYSDHINDTYTDKAKQKHPKPLYRSLIIGIGDQKDKNLLTTEQFKEIMSETVKQFQKDFPEFKVLGATIHEDEKGFHHMHLDFMPLYHKVKGEKSRGLEIGRGLDEALKKMGYKPEQSLINGRDKAPIYFNTLRNRIYKNVEDSLNARGHTLLYNATFYKQPDHDSSVNQKLDRWQATKDTAFTMQKYKNELLELNNDNTIDEELKLQSIAEATINFEKTLNEIEEIPFTRFRNDKIIKFSVFSQLQSFSRNLLTKIRDLAEVAQNALKSLKKANLKIDELSKVVETQSKQIERYTRDNPLAKENQKLKLEAEELSTQINKLEYNSKTQQSKIDKLIENNISLEFDNDNLKYNNSRLTKQNDNMKHTLTSVFRNCLNFSESLARKYVERAELSGVDFNEHCVLKAVIQGKEFDLSFADEKTAMCYINEVEAEGINIGFVRTETFNRLNIEREALKSDDSPSLQLKSSLQSELNNNKSTHDDIDFDL